MEQAIAPTSERSSGIPWYAWTSAIAVTSIAAGLYWDISWHMSIGRDTFWTPAHLAIHFGAIVAVTSAIYLILTTTFGKNRAARESSVRLWGFRGPLGTFVSLWGGLAMLTSAPFDDWWHNAFGLDVQIISPPHMVLGAGIFVLGFGGLILIAALMNRAQGELRNRLNYAFLYVGCLLLVIHMMLIMEYTDHTLMHSGVFYRTVALGIPMILVGLARASGYRWACTMAAGMYTALWLAAEWLVPLVPAEPKLGPVNTRITHLVPLGFPLLVIAGALAMDVLLNRLSARPKWLQAAVVGGGFLAGMIVAQWPMGSLLVSPRAENWIFGTDYYPYMLSPQFYKPYAHQFRVYEKTREIFWLNLGIGLVAAIVSARIGLMWGQWMRELRR